MKIDEVRELLEKYSAKQLRQIVTEMYKLMPKALKETSKIDDLLKNPDAFLNLKKEKKVPPPEDIDDLECEIDDFVENAYKQYYFAPNSIVSKKDRPKWRFVVKQFYKSLLNAARVRENIPKASALLEKLYVMLCYACNYILFSGDDPFQSVGIAQPVFFRALLSLKREHESISVFVPKAISLIVENDVNRSIVQGELMQVALEFFHTPDAKRIAIQDCVEKISHGRLKSTKGLDKMMAEINLRDMRNQLVKIAFLCFFELGEYENGIQLFAKSYTVRDQEIKLYILLRWLFAQQKTDYFVQEYNKAIQAGIKPRKEIVDAFDFIQSTGEFPKYL